MKKVLENHQVCDIKFTHRLKNHPVCLTTEGDISVEMQKVLNALPNDNKINAKMILEINEAHPISKKLKELYDNNQEELEKYTKILYSQARLIEGLPIENPTEISNLISRNSVYSGEFDSYLDENNSGRRGKPKRCNF